MGNMMKNGVMIAALFAGLVVSSTNSAKAQQYSQDSRIYFDYGDPFFSTMSEAPDGKSLDVRVNTASAMFSFLRSDRAHASRGAYYAVREVTMDVVDRSSSESVLSKTVRDTIYSNSYEATTSKNNWHALAQHIQLPELDSAKAYGLRVEIRDGVLDKMAMRPVIAEIAPSRFLNAADSNGIAIGDIMLFDRLAGNSGVSNARGNTYMFGTDVSGTVSFKLADQLPPNATVELDVKQLSNAINPEDIGTRSHVTLTSADLYKGSAMVFASADSTLTYQLAPAADPGVWTAYFTVPGKKFEQGRYAFTVHVKDGAIERSHTNSVNITWQNMPLSLEDPLDAIQPLAHILTEDQMRTLRAGSKQEMLQKLYNYWKTQDPTPETAYNERMAAFYARVDYADFNFATTRTLDGVMSDRGKVYLLYGAPTKIERTFIPGELPVESWSYSNNIRRVFRFEDRGGHGDYRLTDIQNLAAAF